jgi:hypothetical protein
MNPFDPISGAMAVLDAVNNDYIAALVLAETAVDHKVASDAEFQFRLDVLQILAELRVPGAEREYQC